MTRKKNRLSFLLLIFTLLFLNGAAVLAQPVQSKSSEWERTVEAARKEGKVVVSVPTSAELRKEFESSFQKKFSGIELELSVARGASSINKIAEEQNAGVRNVDLHIGGTTSIVTGLLASNLLEPILPVMLLPEVSTTRRFDVDTQWIKEFGHIAAKEALTPEKFDELENGSEEVVLKIRKPAMALAEKLFQ